MSRKRSTNGSGSTLPPVVTIQIHHSSGLPMGIVDYGTNYVGYYRSHDTLWAFVRDRETGRMELFGGDVGWDRGAAVDVCGHADGVHMTTEERLWVIACVIAATGKCDGFRKLVRDIAETPILTSVLRDIALDAERKAAAQGARD